VAPVSTTAVRFMWCVHRHDVSKTSEDRSLWSELQGGVRAVGPVDTLTQTVLNGSLKTGGRSVTSLWNLESSESSLLGS